MFVTAMRRISYWKASLEQEDQSGDYWKSQDER